ncbi:MAG: tryptophan--tRNA ligase [Minisyncoccia bacterium]
MKPILISGIQPTGKLHIGNYLGALKNFVALQNSGRYQCYFFVADLHSLTEDYNPKEKPAQVKDVVLDMLAAGINPKKSVIFIQSSIPAHSELAWILDTVTPMGELNRMTQFKDKTTQSALQNVSGRVISGTMTSEEMTGNYVEHTKKVVSEEINKYINVGLLNYPVLMAADIILYNARFVPVGDDQLQHLEFTRATARRFNSRYGNTFIEPQPILTEASRIMSLDEPKKKMSKSRPAGCLFLDDAPEVIRKKIMSAVTDSGSGVRADIEGKEGIGNLILLYSALSGESARAIEKKYAGKGYGQFKRDLAEIAVNTLVPFQKKKERLKTQSSKLKAILAAGNKKANLVASKKLIEAKKKTGLV